MDCGGGMVDGVTYTVDTVYPLRLRREVVAPGGTSELMQTDASRAH
jgi:hypothetical protein